MKMIVSPEAGAETVAAQALPPQVLVVVHAALWINVGHAARATPPSANTIAQNAAASLFFSRFTYYATTLPIRDATSSCDSNRTRNRPVCV